MPVKRSIRAATLAVAMVAPTLAGAQSADAAAGAACGTWLTADKEGRVHIYRVADGTFAGKIVGGSGGDTDSKNPDPALRSRPLLGLMIMKGFRHAKGIWDGGEIYDPDSGDTYKSQFRLDRADGAKLQLRGYIGIPLFGRPEEWTRFGIPDASACDEPKVEAR
jgi:uncharacterized protein (DUF2147 family)